MSRSINNNRTNSPNYLIIRIIPPLLNPDSIPLHLQLSYSYFVLPNVFAISIKYNAESMSTATNVKKINGFKSFLLKGVIASKTLQPSFANNPPLKKNHIKNIPVKLKRNV